MAGAWVHRLDPARAGFRVHGKPHVWAREVVWCGRCEELYRAGDDEGLVAVHERVREAEVDVEEEIRRPLAVLRGADLGAVEIARWLPPGAAELAAEGFVPVEYLSGGIDVGRVWPAPHRRSVPETRDGFEDGDGDGDGDGGGLFWLVRSPWAAVPVEDVVGLLWEWVEQPLMDEPDEPYDHARHAARVREFLGRDEAWVLDYRRRRGRD